MTTAIEIHVEVDPALLKPAPMDAYLRRSVEHGAERVRLGAEGRIRPSGKVGRLQRAGYGPLGGSLRKHFFAKPSEVSGAYVRTGVFYGRFLEYGTKGHKIAARVVAGRRPALALDVPGGTIFRRSANPKGIVARHWLASAATAATPGIVADFEDETRRWAEAVFGGARG